MQPARRGRAKKTVESVTPSGNEAPVEQVPAATKKSKKPVKVVAVVTPDGIQGSFTPEPRRPLIAHLNVHSSEVKFHDAPIQYDPNPPQQPEPYDITLDNMFSSTQEPLEVQGTQENIKENEEDSIFESTEGVGVEESKDQTKETRPLQLFTRADLMIQYRDSLKTKQIPEKTEIACFWCTHRFDGQPCIIPEREEKGVYRVYGNFCCPPCALSYLLRENIDPHVRWERMALLNRLYDKDGRCRVFPAPAQECLDIFGGPISIESFRATIASQRVRIDVHMPPMVSILGSIDTKPIDFFDSSLKNTLINPIPFEKQAKTEDGLRLKRSKPLKDKDSTLDAVMNIQIKSKK